jgi:hypothetical protein
MLRTSAIPVDLYAASPPVGVAPLPILEAIEPSLTTGNPLGLLTGSPNISKKIDWVRLSSKSRARLRRRRCASALSRIAAISRCSSRGGKRDFVSGQVLPGKVLDSRSCIVVVQSAIEVIIHQAMNQKACI